MSLANSFYCPVCEFPRNTGNHEECFNHITEERKNKKKKAAPKKLSPKVIDRFADYMEGK